jgi:hypothetical protein
MDHSTAQTLWGYLSSPELLASFTRRYVQTDAGLVQGIHQWADGKPALGIAFLKASYDERGFISW